MTTINSTLLKSAPLKEVIFELHWELDFIPQQNVYVDNGFEEAVMNFRNSCEDDFKEFQLLVPAMIPFTLLKNKVTHRFFREKKEYPLYQLGPGVFTVNDNNKNYSWDDFKNLVLNGIRCLKESYKKELVISKVELRYIDAVNCSILGNTDKFDFLKDHLNVNAESYPFVNGQLVDINFTKKFLIENESFLNIMVATGKEKNSNEDAIIWHTFINNKERVIWSTLDEWLNNAHKHCSDSFTKMISKKLYEYFS